MSAIFLQLRRLYWAWMLAEARQFRAGLERTIVRERERAKCWVEQAELMERRAEMAIIADRATRGIVQAMK